LTNRVFDVTMGLFQREQEYLVTIQGAGIVSDLRGYALTYTNKQGENDVHIKHR
jgi:hypothetical protein